MMFEYFPDNYPWSMAAVMAINAGAVLSEVDEALKPLKPVAAANDDDILRIIFRKRANARRRHTLGLSQRHVQQVHERRFLSGHGGE